MQSLLIPFFQVLDVILELYSWCVIIVVVMSWLINFNVQSVRAHGDVDARSTG